VIQLFATGVGQTTPAGSDGSINSLTTLMPLPSNVQVEVTIGGIPATLEFAGAAPGLITGTAQINALIPQSVIPGPAVPISFSVNGISSPTVVTIAVQ